MGNTHISDGGQVRLFLRQETASEHARLDALVSGLDLADRRDYTDFLRGSAAALLPLEQALESAGVSDVLPDWPRRTRSAAILADLSDLSDLDDPAPATAVVGVDVFARARTVPADRAAMLGVLYVLEGSRLGARGLHVRVAASDDPIVAETTRYLTHGASDRLWRGFLAVLDAHGHADRDAMAAGAKVAFGCFAAAMDRILADRRPAGVTR